MSYVIVAKERRGEGLGHVLLLEAEAVALSLGYQYVYLWTQIPGFYAKLGYKTCERVAMASPALRKLSSSGLAGLEGLFGRKARVVTGGGGGSGGGGVGFSSSVAAEAASQSDGATAVATAAVTAAATAAVTVAATAAAAATRATATATAATDVWMRKRISKTLWDITRITETEAQKAVQHAMSADNVIAFVRPVQVALQVGPCCGICALASARKCLLGKETDGQEVLTFAKEKGFSQDGEIFDMESFASLAQSQGLDAHVFDIRDLTARDIFSRLLDDELLIVPFDCERGELSTREGYKVSRTGERESVRVRTSR